MKFLFDTSVWIDHFRKGNSALILALEDDALVINEVIIGELAAGNLHKRKKLLDELDKLHLVPIPSLSEMLGFIDSNKLFALGLSWSDLQILASALVSNVELVTLDKKLSRRWDRLRR